ncbi:MAG: hypothetical protein ACRCTR_02530 [Actinomycetota bacterium]
MSAPENTRPRRPAFLTPAACDAVAGGSDPAEVAATAYATASAIVDAGRDRADPELTARLVRLVDDHGLDTLAALWAEQPARSLPGALWRLYVVREWVHQDPASASSDYAAGRPLAEVAGVIAGVADPPGPQEVQQLADDVLTGVYQGDFGVALERAAAFCRVVAAGRVRNVDDATTENLAAQVITRRAAALTDTADDLAAAARAWRARALT